MSDLVSRFTSQKPKGKPVFTGRNKLMPGVLFLGLGDGDKAVVYVRVAGGKDYCAAEFPPLAGIHGSDWTKSIRCVSGEAQDNMTIGKWFKKHGYDAARLESGLPHLCVSTHDVDCDDLSMACCRS